jgi:hypothetical protein
MAVEFGMALTSVPMGRRAILKFHGINLSVLSFLYSGSVAVAR